MSRRDRRRDEQEAMPEEGQYQSEETRQINRRIKKRGKEIYIAGYLMVAVFAAMLVYFLWFEINGKTEVLINPLNNRSTNMEQSVRKGDIVTADNVVIATTQNMEDGTEYRYYPFANVFAHPIGFAVNGGLGLEGKQKINLLTSHDSFLLQLRTELMHQKVKGDTMNITLDYGMQTLCYNLLAQRNGAIVVMEVKTGKVLAMVSSPDFDPNTVEQEWANINASGTASLVNRASQGRYAPGSTFKMITLLEYIRENPSSWQDFHYTCNGVYVDGDYVVNCHEGHAHGEVDIYGALAQSCNGAFISMGLTLDPVKWQALAEDFGYNQKDLLEIEFNRSSFTLEKDAEIWDMIQASIGQGTTLTTPLLNTMITAAIANQGVMMKPYLISNFTSVDGGYQKTYEPEILRNCISSSEASLLKEFMTSVVRDGSGYQAASRYFQVAGKTGSAQYSSEAGRYHAWFTGFAPNEDAQIALTVLIEDGGSGGEVAAPIAAQIFDYYFERSGQTGQ